MPAVLALGFAGCGAQDETQAGAVPDPGAQMAQGAVVTPQPTPGRPADSAAVATGERALTDEGAKCAEGDQECIQGSTKPEYWGRWGGRWGGGWGRWGGRWGYGRRFGYGGYGYGGYWPYYGYGGYWPYYGYGGYGCGGYGYGCLGPYSQHESGNDNAQPGPSPQSAGVPSSEADVQR